MSRFFAVSGAPGAGKSTVLEILRERGYAIVPESARAIIRERRSAGLSPRPEPQEFARQILARDIAQYEQAESGAITLFDRSVVDALVMLERLGALPAAKSDMYLRRFRYDETVFVFPAWREIFRTDAERDQSFPDAQKVYEEVVRGYANFEFIPVEVPLTDAESRADFIEERLPDTR